MELAADIPLGTICVNQPAQHEHDLCGVVNLDLGPAWEFNFGCGSALTAAGDKHLVKMILGRRVGR